MIDTNIAIDIRDGVDATLARLVTIGQVLTISVFTLIELEGGIYANSEFVAVRRRRVDAMLAEMLVAAFDPAVVAAYGRIVAQIGFSRSRIIDRLIAATAIIGDFTLLTANLRDFAGIPDLKLQSWAEPAQ